LSFLTRKQLPPFLGIAACLGNEPDGSDLAETIA